MARRRTQTVETGGEDLILPRHLADRHDWSKAEARERSSERSAWFTARGIDPHDWSRVYPVLKASWEAYGLPRGAATRARLRVSDPREVLRHQIEMENR